MTANSVTTHAATNGKKTSHDKALPVAWKVDPSLLAGLKLPLETSKNNLMELDLPRKSGILDKRELDITESYSIDQLLTGMAKGSLTCLEVTTAFAKRASIAHQVVC
jgi:amidase